MLLIEQPLLVIFKAIDGHKFVIAYWHGKQKNFVYVHVK